MKLRWDDIEVVENNGQVSGRILITDNKSGRPFHLPLSSAAMQVIEEIPNVAGSPWLFPSPLSPEKHLTQFPRKAWQVFKDRAGLQDLHIHDLRRTFASWLTEFGEPEELVAKMLNQTSTTVTRTVYAHRTQAPLERAANQHGDKIMEFMKIKKQDERTG